MDHESFEFAGATLLAVESALLAAESFVLGILMKQLRTAAEMDHVIQRRRLKSELDEWHATPSAFSRQPLD